MPWRAVQVPSTNPVELGGFSPGRKSLSVFNNGTASIFYSQDPSSLTTTGFVLTPGSAVTLNRDDGDEPEAPLYGQASAGTQDIRVQESVGPAVPVGP